MVKAPNGEVIGGNDETNTNQYEMKMLGSPLRTDNSLPQRMSPSKSSALKVYEKGIKSSPLK